MCLHSLAGVVDTLPMGRLPRRRERERGRDGALLALCTSIAPGASRPWKEGGREQRGREGGELCISNANGPSPVLQCCCRAGPCTRGVGEGSSEGSIHALPMQRCTCPPAIVLHHLLACLAVATHLRLYLVGICASSTSLCTLLSMGHGGWVEGKGEEHECRGTTHEERMG